MTAAHVARYLHRVDERLPTLPDDVARANFLHAEAQRWLARFERFMVAVDNDVVTSAGVTAWDYHDTVAELAMRVEKLLPKEPCT